MFTYMWKKINRNNPQCHSLYELKTELFVHGLEEIVNPNSQKYTPKI